MIMVDQLKVVVLYYMFLKDSLYLVHIKGTKLFLHYFKVLFHPKYEVHNILLLLVEPVLISISAYLQFEQVHS